MNIDFGDGCSIGLTGDEVASAIDAWLLAHGVKVSGPRTITVNGDLCSSGLVYVDPAGSVSIMTDCPVAEARRSKLENYRLSNISAT